MELFKDPKKLIAVFVVLAIVALAIGFGYMWFQNQKAPDGQFNFVKCEQPVEQYVAVHADLIYAPDGVVRAPEEKQFYIVDIILQNDNYDPGLNTLELQWKLTIDNMTFPMDIARTPLYKGFTDMTFEKGKLWGYTVVFTIPKTIALVDVDISMGYTYLSTNKAPNLEYNADLKLPDPKTNVSDIVFASRF